MDYLYDHREAGSLKPYVYTIDSALPVHLFPMPQNGAVGTNDLNNAITIFTFAKDRLVPKVHFRNAFKYVGGGGQYLPEPLSEHSIGFAQTRRFVIYDFLTNKAKDYTITRSMDRNILHAGVADASKNRFFFEIEAENPNSEDYNDVSRTIWLMDLNDVTDGRPRIINKYEKTKGSVWSTFNNQLLFCDFKNIELKVFDANLNPSNHPVEGALKKNKGKVDFVDVIPHPSLPFAILSGGEQGAQYICWNQAFRSEEARTIFGHINALCFTFSPDGRWVAFQKDEPDPKYSYIMPISEKYPNYLGSPILLEGATFDRGYFAWTNNPVHLVGSTEGKLYRYDLTKEAHPEAASYPSYWDYVVEKDLEKLRKAGKQGLKP